MALPNPVAQKDRTQCWAASLEWWARAMNRPVILQNNLLMKYIEHWDSRMYLADGSDNPDYGTVTRDGLLKIWQDSIWVLNTEALNGGKVTADYLKAKVSRGPCIIGYYEPRVKGKHVVCPWAVADPNAAVMNPDGGKMENMPLLRYQNTTEILIAWPK